MRKIKDKYDNIEFKTYAAYSEVAKEAGMTVDQVSTIYEWFLKKTVEDMIELPTVKVRLSGLGVLVFNPKKALKIIAAKIKSETLLTGATNREGLTPIRGYSNYYMLEDWMKLFEDRYNRAKSKKLYAPVVEDFYDRSYLLVKENHKKLYESLQRVHGPEPEGAKESRQSVGGSSYEDSESI